MVKIGLCMVKDEADIIKEMLDNNSKFCDGFCVIDNGSTDGTYDIVKNHPAVIEVVQDFGEFDERRMIKDMLIMADKYKADWYFDADADELFDEKTIKLFENDLGDANVITFNFRYCFAKRRDRCYKIYRHWCKFFKNLGLDELIAGCDKAVAKLHWGKCPIPRENRKYYHSEIPIHHFQCRSYEQTMNKYNRYLELDRDAIQSEGYEHLKFAAKALKTGDYSGFTWRN